MHSEMLNVIVISFLVILVIFLRVFLEELWTILQIIKSFFMPKINIKKKYGSWAVVTGSTDGIGKAFALELASRGLNIVLISRNPSKLEDVSLTIQKTYNVQTKIIAADFSKGREIFENIKQALEGLDVGVLVNNVGIQYSYPMYFGELPEDELWSLININVGAATQMTRIIIPEMTQKNRGAIINICSGSKLQPLPFMNLYAASKIFIDYFTDALRNEYKNFNLTIQSLCPYYISTKINHFNDRLMKVNIFIPTAEKYAKSALNSLGIIDNTTGYWPHRFQYCLFYLAPVWLKIFIGGKMYKAMRDSYLKSRSKSVNK